MVIKCGGCLRKFNLDESLLRPDGSKVKCTKCGNIFCAFPPLPGSPKALSGKDVNTKHLNPDSRNPSPADRIRQHTRIEISVPVSCIPEDSEGNPLNLYMGHVTEVSQTGVAVELFGDSISGVVSLSFINHEDETIQIKGRIEHSVQTESSRARIGVSLLGASRQIGQFVTNLVRAHYLTNKLEQD
jgi:predicted Zn finger-like uncharacterized protein